MQKFDIIIVGAGASGCMCALSCKNKNIAIIDNGKIMGKKLLVTGNGRCNISNNNMDSKFFNQNIDIFLNQFSVSETLKMFKDLGLVTFSDEAGRIYPLSNSAKSVVDVINISLKNKVYPIMEEKVVDVEKTKDGFIVKTEKSCYLSNKAVIATGGNTALNICKKHGIKYKTPVYSLVSLKCSDVRDLNGIKLSNVLVTAIHKNGKTMQDVGEVLFKDEGLSGIVIFNMSSLFARNGSYNGKIKIDILPNFSHEQLNILLRERRNLSIKADKFLVGMFQNAVSNEIFRQAKINTNVNSANLSDNDIKKLVDTIKNLEFNVVDCYDNNQIHSGGVLLSELDENLMSKNVDGLYFAGEVCDVDGVCGGYNLQWAWTSGHVVGVNL